MAPTQKQKPASSSGGLTWLLAAAVPVLLASLYLPEARNLIFGNVSETRPAVTIRQGTIVGKILDDDKFPAPIEGFLGIPYALPPVNNLRFRPATPVPDGNGTLEAFFMGPR